MSKIDYKTAYENVMIANKMLEQENKQLKERFERLKQEHIDTITRNEEKQQRIDKAIEYIEDRFDGEVFTHTFSKCNMKELYEILGDKENEET